jgi:hypothetical protein
MSSSTSANFTYHVMQPEGRAFLTSRVLLHSAYQVADLPREEIDFEDATKAMPLLVALKPTGPCVLSIAARPAYGDGAASQWLEFMMRHEGYDHGPITRTQVGIYPGVMCDARQVADGAVMQMRFILLEDGGRLVILNGMAPAEFWLPAEEQLMTMLRSFEFQQDQGATAALFPGEQPPAPAKSVAGLPRPEPAEGGEAVPGSATPATGVAGPASPHAAASTASAAHVPTARLTAEEFAQLVLADDATSFDQDVGINANLRDRGIGFVPRVLGLDPAEKSARLGAGAIEAVFRLPYGWYAMDDGRRTLIFDRANGVQINLSLRPFGGGSFADFARELVVPYLEREPDLPLAVLEFADGIAGAGVRGASIDGETLDQVFLVRAAGRPGYLIVARVTASSADTTRAVNLAGDILARLETADQLAAAN